MKREAERLRILFGTAVKTARGGINACEPPFVEAVRRAGAQVVEEIYLFDNDKEVSSLRRVFQVVGAARRLRQAASVEDFDVIHLNTSFEMRSLLRDSFTLFMLGRRKVFLKFHGSNLRLLSSRNPLVRILVSYVTRKASGMGLLSSEEKTVFESSGVSGSKLHLVKNTVESVDFPHVEKRSDARKKLLFVSRLVKTKGLEDSVRAAKLLVDSGLDVSLDVLGSGEAKEPAEALVSELGLSGRVFFHGHVSEEKVRGFLASSDILVFPTFHDEGFPMVVFGALRFGIPIVTTKARASADYLREGENCLFCLPHDSESVAAAVKKIVGDKGLSRRISESNIRLAERFTPDVIASEYLDVYRKVAQSDPI